jgi:hypothetical protein
MFASHRYGTNDQIEAEHYLQTPHMGSVNHSRYSRILTCIRYKTLKDQCSGVQNLVVLSNVHRSSNKQHRRQSIAGQHLNLQSSRGVF